jgi:hypothetical protein
MNQSAQSCDGLVTELSSAGFTGERFTAHGKEGYLIGDKFLQLITFLGCAPHIEISPPENPEQWHQFCHIEFQRHSSAHFFKGLNNPKCACPECKARVTALLPDMLDWQPGTKSLTCPKCQTSSLTEQLNWRHGGGFGQFFIVVHSVYPNEAVPTDQLMSLLKTSSGFAWDYFYFER